MEAVDVRIEWGQQGDGKRVVTFRCGNNSYSVFGPEFADATRNIGPPLIEWLERQHKRQVAYEAYRAALAERPSDADVAAAFEEWWIKR